MLYLGRKETDGRVNEIPNNGVATEITYDELIWKTFYPTQNNVQ